MQAPREVESLFNNKASTWSQKYSANGPLRYRLDAFKAELGALVAPPARVLDFGCGTGNLAAYLSSCDFTVSACDISLKMIEQARANNPDAPIKWFALPTDWQELPFASDAFDAVVASSAFEYLTDLDRTFVECRRILKPGGVLIATVPDSRKLIRRLEDLFRPAAVLLANVPVLNRVPKLGSYTTYLKCSRNRLSLEKWFAFGDGKHFVAVDQHKSRAGNSALAFVRFRKPSAHSNST